MVKEREFFKKKYKIFWQGPRKFEAPGALIINKNKISIVIFVMVERKIHSYIFEQLQANFLSSRW